MEATLPTTDRVFDALGLPESCQLRQRVPKKLLLENGAPTVGDKRLVTEAVEDIRWVAAIKPNKVGIPEYRDAVREYLEIAVLVVTLRTAPGRTTRPDRIAELLHRAIPYPVFLMLQEDASTHLSLAHKRWAQNEADKVVLEGDEASVVLTDETPAPEILDAFLKHLPLERQPRESLFTVYQGWIDCLVALQAALLTGRYAHGGTPEDRARRRDALLENEQLTREAIRLQGAAAKEKQMARRVELNLALRNVQARQTALRAHL